jgi:nicotinate-nucleotide adenylyltransferase
MGKAPCISSLYLQLLLSPAYSKDCSNSIMRIALFGGTFDPIHHGHLAVAAAAADTFALDQVLFAPAGRQPLKPEHPSASFSDRLAMTTLACDPTLGADPRFTTSTLDAPRPDGTPNYTVDTLTTLQHQLPDATLFVIVGADSFLALRRWRQPDHLLELAQWIVVSRPGFPLENPTELSHLALTPTQQSRIHLLLTLHEDVSSTILRDRLHHGDPCTDLLPPAVSAYIQDHHLYR